MRWMFRLSLRVMMLLIVIIISTLITGRLSTGMIVTAEVNQNIQLVDVGQQVSVNLTPLDGMNVNYSHPIWSPDGERLAFFRWFPDENMANIVVMNVWSRRWERFNAMGSFQRGMSWSPDGKTIAYVRMDWPAPRELFNVATLDHLQGHKEILTQIGIVVEPRWSPQGDTIAFRAVNDLYIVDAASSEVTQLTNQRNTMSYVWSTDGATMMTINALASDLTAMYAIELENTRLVGDFTGCPNRQTEAYVSISPDGKHILTFTPWRGLIVVDAQSCDVRSVIGGNTEVKPVWVDNESFFIYDNQLYLYHINGDLLHVTPFAATINHISLRPN